MINNKDIIFSLKDDRKVYSFLKSLSIKLPKISSTSLDLAHNNNNMRDNNLRVPQISSSTPKPYIPEDLYRAIKNKDATALLSILEDSTSSSSIKSLNDISIYLLDNFNASTMSVALDQGMIIDKFRLLVSMGKSKDLDMIEFFASRSQLDQSTSRSPQIDDNTINQSDGVDTVSESFGYAHIWNSFFLSSLLSKDIQNRDIIRKLEDIFPTILNDTLSVNYLATFLKVCTNSKWHQDILLKVSHRTWSDFFKGDLLSSSGYLGVRDGWSFKEDTLLSLFSVIQKDDQIKEFWNLSQQKKLDAYNYRELWFDKYIPRGVDIIHTPFYEIMLNSYLPSSIVDGIETQEFSSYGKAFAKHFLKDFNEKFNFFKSAQKLSMSLADYLRTHGDHLFEGKLLCSLIDRRSGKLAFDALPAQQCLCPSFIHDLVASGGPIVNKMLITKGGREIVRECFESLYVQEKFIQSAPHSLFIYAIKFIPDLRGILDNNNNSLGLRYVIQKDINDEGMALDLFNTSPLWFEQTNANGESMLGKLKYNGLKDEAVAQIEKKIIKNAIKKEDIIRYKIHSRDKHSSSKRKI